MTDRECLECHSGLRGMYPHTLNEYCPAHLAVLAQAKIVAEALGELNRRWNVADHTGAFYADGYPFGGSLDEVAFAAHRWAFGDLVVGPEPAATAADRCPRCGLHAHDADADACEVAPDASAQVRELADQRRVSAYLDRFVY